MGVCIPPSGNLDARGTNLERVEKRNCHKTDRRIRSEHRLRLPKVDTFKKYVVRDKPGDHGKPREVPLIPPHPKKNPLQHSSAWTRARTGDPFLFREVLYQLSYPSPHT